MTTNENQKYKELINDLPNLFFLLDNKNNVIIINKVAAKFLGEKISNIEGKPIFKFLPRQKAELIKRHKKIFRTGKTDEFEDFLQIPDGSFRWFWSVIKPIKNKKGKVEFIQVISHDITSKKEAENELIENQQKFYSFFNNVNDAIFVHDAKTGEILDVNKKTVDEIGYSKEEFKKINIGDFSSGVEPYTFKNAVKLIKKALKKPQIFEWHVKSKNGNLFWMEVNLKKISILGQDYIVAIARNISENKEAQLSLEEEKNITDSMINSVPGVFYIFDKEGKFLLWNRNLEKISGFSKKEIENMSPLDFFGVKEKIRIIKIIKEVFDKGFGIIETEILTKKRKTIPFYFNSSLIEIKHKNYLIGTGLDISKRIKAENKLKENERLLSNIIGGSAVPTFVINKEHRVTHWNSACEKVFETPAGEMLNKKRLWEPFYYKKRPVMADLVLEKAVTKDFDKWYTRDGKPFHKKSYLVEGAREAIDFFPKLGKDGKWLFFTAAPLKNKKGEIIGAIESIQDITERKKREEDLRQSEERNKAIIKNVGEGVFVVDKKGKILLFNDYITRVTGYSKKEVLGKNYKKIFKFIFHNGNCKPKCFIEKSLEKEKFERIEEKNIELVKKDKTKIFIKGNANPLRGKKGEIIGAVVVIRDITKDRELRKMKDEFISMASHQLGTPLTGIKWFTELLLEQKFGKLNENQKEFVEKIHLGSEKLIKISKDLLDVSRIETGKKFKLIKKRIRVDQVICGILNDIDFLVTSKDIKVKVDINPCEDKVLIIDPEKTKMIFFNLIDNAIKYSKTGGKIEIGCSKKSKNNIIFYVKDNGIGISKSENKNVFQSFFRGENIATQSAGTGLGLYIAKAFVEAHEGNMWFKSKEGQGTTFFFSLPFKKK
ncbi:PAS domain-containing sensor histidine kinase [Patescibacteria group bacterium]|nr:PAS domain-containing sensor histidine kinase [Patescibacteria group bacterium]